MIMNPEILDYIFGDGMPFKCEPLHKLVEEHQLNTYVHDGYWQCMDTLNEKNKLEKLWIEGKAPWKIWNEQLYYVIYQYITKG